MGPCILSHLGLMATLVFGALPTTPALADSGIIDLGSLNGGTYSDATGVSADGEMVVGVAPDGAADNVYRAFRWTQAGGKVSLGVLNGDTESWATGVSANGEVVIGWASDGAADNADRAFRWTKATGMQTVEDGLRANGVAVPTDMTRVAEAVNATGNVIVGELEYGHAFIARVETTPNGGGSENGGSGSGLLELDETLTASLGSPAAVSPTALRTGELILDGEHGRPVSYRVAPGQRTVWGSGDRGRDDHDPLDGNAALGEVGAGDNFGPVQANVALGRTWTNQNLVASGDMNAAGSYLWAEALAPLHGNLWGVLGGYDQWGDANVHRGYRNAGTPDTSTGSPDTHTWGVRGHLEWDGAAKPGGAA